MAPQLSRRRRRPPFLLVSSLYWRFLSSTGTIATVKAHFAVPYIQWGLKDPGFMFWKADKDVAIDLFLNGRISQ